MLKNIFEIVLALISSIGYGLYNLSKNTFKDSMTLVIMSFFFGLGVFCLIKSFQYLISEKVMAKIIKQSSSDVNTGKVQDIGSYSRGYSYSYLINGEKYTMPKYFFFGSRYKIGDVVKVSIVNRKKKIVMPIRAVFNIILIGIVAIYMSIKMMGI